MQPEQYILLDMIYGKSRELDAELKPQPVTRKQLENAPARQYGRLVGRDPEAVRPQLPKLATDSGVYHLR